MRWIDDRRFQSAGIGVLALGVAGFLGFGFTVDDALISTRVAHHLSAGQGYRFNIMGPRVDAVTPLGWAWLLAPLATLGPVPGLLLARWLGLACLLGCGGLVGWLCGQSTAPSTAAPGLSRRALAALGPWAVAAACLPLGAWSVSGMETPLVMLSCTLGLFGGPLGCISRGLAASWRPELIPWALTLSVLYEDGASPVRRVRSVLGTLAFPLGVALLRAYLFGSPAPLAVWAKPSDLSSGIGYVAGGLRLLGIPLLLCSVRGWRTLSGSQRAVAYAAAAHVLALVAAGGDWMSLFRLFVPILPGLLWVAVGLNRGGAAPLWSLGLRAFAGLSMAVLLQVQLGPSTRGIWQQRMELVDGGKLLLAESQNVASLDVGWVGAAFPGTVTDLAGVTDRLVAVLPGGHTSKQLPVEFLQQRDVDTLVLLLAPGVTLEGTSARAPGADSDAAPVEGWRQLRFARAVEQRVTLLRGAGEFVPVGSLPLRGTDQRYLVLRRLTERFAERPSPRRSRRSL